MESGFPSRFNGPLAVRERIGDAVTLGPTGLGEECLSGWGRYPVQRTYLNRPESLSSLASSIGQAGARTVVARGYGRSYGDAAINADGLTILTERLDRLLSFDVKTGILSCESGVALGEILRVFVPDGWFLPVTPGTQYVTVGGALASDVHGKNHHQDGSFSRFVQSFRIVLASGEHIECSRERNSDLFWATIGGMGLTGIVTDVRFGLLPIESAFVELHRIKASNLDEALALFDEHEPRYRYSVAWVDCLAKGRNQGRSILYFGNHARVEALSPVQQRSPLALSARSHITVPFDMPWCLLNAQAMACFNDLYYARHAGKEKHRIVDLESFFYPHDALLSWNKLCGPAGFVQFQSVVPLESGRTAIRQLLSEVSQKGRDSFLAVLKKFGDQEGWLSFPMPGYTLTLNIPVRDGILEFMSRLEELVIGYGGRVYLAKDACLTAEGFRKMYPKFPQWLEVKSRVDPEDKFSSSLSRRLRMHAL